MKMPNTTFDHNSSLIGMSQIYYAKFIELKVSNP